MPRQQASVGEVQPDRLRLGDQVADGQHSPSLRIRTPLRAFVPNVLAVQRLGHSA